MYKQEMLKDLLIEMGINDKEVYDKLIKYRQLILEWNNKINLTSIIDEEEMYLKHFIDSFLVLKTDINFNNKKIMDIGTGAGFPGIPLAILSKKSEFCLLDSLQKRIVFLNIVTKELHLKNIELIHGRAEDYAKQEKYREKFDIVTSRAVADFPVLLEYSLPFLKNGGYFIAYKGKNYRNEVDRSNNALEILGGKIVNNYNFELPLIYNDRNFIIVEKIGSTPFRYPRKAGKALKNPL